MEQNQLGMDRTVAASWAPDDTWPAFTDEFAAELGEAPGDGSVALASAHGGASGGGAPAGEPDAFDALQLDQPDDPTDGVEAVAAIEGHPLHPALVPLPIASFVGAFLCDLAYLRTHDRFWARGGRLLTGAGLLTGLAAGSLGALDFTGRSEIRSRRAAWVHAGGNLAVLGMGAVSEALRTRDERRAVSHGALALSAASVGLLALTGWLGGELAFRERIGVAGR